MIWWFSTVGQDRTRGLLGEPLGTVSGEVGGYFVFHAVCKAKTW